MRLVLILLSLYKVKKKNCYVVSEFSLLLLLLLCNVTYWLILFTRAFTRVSHLSITTITTVGNESTTTNAQPTGMSFLSIRLCDRL